ncbi:MAG: TorF family putative porin [bacterium]|nr:TorF family putative porin [bacterium]
MRKSILGLSGPILIGALVAMSAPALAQDAPAPELTVTGNAAVVTDYRFRGISQTNRQFALQGGITVSHASGFYASVWGSSIDDYVYNGGDQELDLIAGYSKTVGAATFDAGVLYYYYPGTGGINSDFFEPYASVKGTFGPATAKVTANYAPKQAAIGLGSQVPGGGPKKDNLYLAADVATAIPNMPVGLTGHFGHSFGPSYLVPYGKGYNDWSVGATYTWSHLTFGVSYVDTNTKFLVNGKNEAKSGIVGSVTAAF